MVRRRAHDGDEEDEDDPFRGGSDCGSDSDGETGDGETADHVVVKSTKTETFDISDSQTHPAAQSQDDAQDDDDPEEAVPPQPTETGPENVPRDTRYFLHDNRGADVEEAEKAEGEDQADNTEKGRRQRKIDESGPWPHDKFFELENWNTPSYRTRRVPRSRQYGWGDDSSWSQPSGNWWDSSDSWEGGNAWGKNNQDDWNSWRAADDGWQGGWSNSWSEGRQGRTHGSGTRAWGGNDDWEENDNTREDDAYLRQPTKRYSQMTF